jgi:NADH:ubiquinone oxidoreductase subunit 5 (subunit L)/multisubunit Na+/H+ antiporter MnhA subunit
MLYQDPYLEFLVTIYLDWIGFVFLLLGNIISLFIIYFSKTYLQWEESFKRYFITILIFYFGYNLTVLSGNLETLSIGWEVLGISSFLLIGFYRTRFIPVRNAVKVFSIYRIGDVGLILAIWGIHHYFNGSVSFTRIQTISNLGSELYSDQGVPIFIAFCLLVAASAKSASFPFSTWLPRAMEGPTPSSAIFYGALSVHMGVFLLIRSFPFWSDLILFRWLVAGAGLITFFSTLFIAKVQYTIKTRIGYKSLTHIGLIFIEISLGLLEVAVIHSVLNAVVRTYQLLVSPSSVSFLIRDQFFHFKPRISQIESSRLKKFHATLYHLSMKEFYFDVFLDRFLFGIYRSISEKLHFLTPLNFISIYLPMAISGLLLVKFRHSLPFLLDDYLPILFAFLSIFMIMKAFSERRYPRLVWLLNIFSHFNLVIAVILNEKVLFYQVTLYLSGVIVSGIVGYIVLEILRRKERKYFDLDEYYGHITHHRILAKIFFISTLGLMGFPITTTFLGEDLLFSHITQNQYLLAFFFSLSYVLGGISLIRLYSKLFLGPSIRRMNETTIHSA